MSADPKAVNVLAANQLVKIEITDDFATALRGLVATYQDGRKLVWGRNITTERGARRMLSIYAKRHGLTVDGKVAALARCGGAS